MIPHTEQGNREAVARAIELAASGDLTEDEWRDLIRASADASLRNMARLVDWYENDGSDDELDEVVAGFRRVLIWAQPA